MINNINDSIINNQLTKQKEISLVDRAKTGRANLYAVNNASYDKTEISDTAISLYQKEKDIDKYKKLVMESLDETDGTDELSKLIADGKYAISDEDLADSLFANEDFTNLLF